jgi:hypothetical protein
MFRPRPPRRPPRGGPRPRAALEALRRANRLMEAGQYEQAFPIWKRLADGTARHGMPVRAANLYLQASRARLEMGSSTGAAAADAAALARRAIHLLVNAGQGQRAGAMLSRIIQALENKGFHEEAVSLRAEVTALLGQVGAAQKAPAQARGTLPTRCPSCSGPVRSDEVSWVDDRTAECTYCGLPIRAE